VWAILRIFPSPEVAIRLILAFSAIPQAFGLLEYVSIFQSLGQLAIMMTEMMLEFLNFAVIYVFCIAGAIL
jgi:hypothetical protein